MADMQTYKLFGRPGGGGWAGPGGSRVTLVLAMYGYAGAAKDQGHHGS